MSSTGDGKVSYESTTKRAEGELAKLKERLVEIAVLRKAKTDAIDAAVTAAADISA